MNNEDIEFCDVSILIVCYKSRDLIEGCLRSIREQTNGVNYEVLLLDNSDDGTEVYVRKTFPWVRVLGGLGNIGFGPANNVLAEAAEGEFLMFLNPDTIIRDNAISRLVSFAKEHPYAGGWGGLCILRDGSPDPGCFQAPKTLVHTVLGAVLPGRWSGRQKEADVRSVPILTGAFLMMTRIVWKDVGGFDESFFLYSEEADLCRRVLNTGRELLLNMKIEITHFVGSDAPKCPDRLVRMARGNMHYHWKHHRYAANIVGVLVWCRHATRWLGGCCGGFLLGRERANLLRIGHAKVVFHPRAWWRGC